MSNLPGSQRVNRGASSACRVACAILIAALTAVLPPAQAQDAGPVLIKEVVTREYSAQVGGVQTPEPKELVSREASLFIESGPREPYAQVISREVSLGLGSAAAPPPITDLSVAVAPTGESVVLDWSAYNQWAVGDIARFDLYVSDAGPITDITGLTPAASPGAGATGFTLRGLTAFTDHFIAVVPVDLLGHREPLVTYSAAYVLSPEVVSRELSLLVGGEPSPPYRAAVSREVSLSVVSAAAPPAIVDLKVSASATGDSATLDWSGYNPWAVGDIDHFAVYLSDRGPITDVTGMTPIRRVSAEALGLTLEGLTPFVEHYFAVVPVDGQGRYAPAVAYAAAYVLSPQALSREVSLLVGGASDPSYPQAISREASILVPDAAVPAPVTGIDSGFLVETSPAAFGAVEMDWSGYNETAQRDVLRYRIYVGPAFFDTVAGLTPFASVPAGTQRHTLTGLPGGAILHFAVVAEDALGNRDPRVRSFSAKASVAGVGEVTDLSVAGGADRLTFTWQPPAETGAFLAGYRLYFAGAAPVELPSTATTWQATGLDAARSYPLRLATVDMFGTESSGVSLLAVTWLPHPRGLDLAATGVGVELSWSAAEPASLVGYYAIYRSMTPFSDLSGLSPVATTTGTSHPVGTLDDVEGRYFAVATVNLAGAVDPSVTAIYAGDFRDLVPPVIESVQFGVQVLADGATLTRPNRLSVAVSDASGVERVDLLVDGGLLAADTNASDGFGADWDIAAILDGPHTLTVMAQDAFGNRRTLALQLAVALAPPPAPVIQSPVDGIETQRPTIEVTGTATPDAAILLFRNAQQIAGPLAVGPGGAFAASIDLVEGDNRIEAAPVNRGGTGPRSAPVTIRRIVEIAFDVLSIQAPNAGAQGQQVQIGWVTRNTGTRPAPGPWGDVVYLSADQGVGGDVMIGRLVFPAGDAVAPGATYTRSASLTVPKNLPDGDYWPIVVADADNSVSAAGPAKTRVASQPIAIKQVRPDLVVTALTPPSDGVRSGSTTEVSFVVKNVGTAPASGNWTDAVLFVPTPEIIAPGFGLDNHIVLGNPQRPQVLQPGESYRQTVAIKLPEDQIGTWYIAVYADAILHTPDQARIHHLRELNELNNVAFDNFQIAPAPQPDLVAGNLHTDPRPVFSGQELAVSWTETNQGQGATDDGVTRTARVYLSTNANPAIDPANDLLLAEVTTAESLGPQAVAAPQTSRAAGRVRADLHGTYYAKVEVNAARTVTEVGGFANNVAVSEPFEVILSVPVDLVATGIDADDQGLSGHELSVAWSAENQGAEPEFDMGWDDAIWLSSDATLDRKTDILLGRFAGPGSTGAGHGIEPYSRARQVRLPNGLADGSYYLIVAIDDGNRVYELAGGEANNILATSAPILVESVPTDLVPAVDFDAAHPFPTAAAAGQGIALSWRVRNLGDSVTPVPGWTDRVWFSRDTQVDKNDVQLAEVAHAGVLLPGADYLVEQTAELPLVSPGDYYLILVTDAQDQVYEQSPGEGNNQIVIPFTVIDDVADLVVDDQIAPSTVPQGGILRVEWQVSNVGTLPTEVGHWGDAVDLSADDQPGNDIALARVPFDKGPLLPAASYSAATVIDLPDDIAPGLYTLFVRTDRVNQVFEGNDVNNHRSLSLLVTGAGAELPNLVPSGVQSEASGIAGQPFTVSWTLTNTGTGPTEINYWHDSVYLSQDAYFDKYQDRFIGSLKADDFLAAGAGRVLTLKTDLPSDLAPGDYSLFVLSDAQGKVYETQEGDNRAAAPGTVHIAASMPADLVVTAITPPAAAMLGEKVRIAWEVTNASDRPITGRWEDAVYLSADTAWDLDDTRLGSLVVSPQRTLEPGEHIRVEGDFRIRAPLPGAYHVFVRTDVLNQIPEEDEGNNLSAASQASIDIAATPLTLGVPYEGLMAPLEDRYFYFDAPDGEAIRIALTQADSEAWTEFYVAREYVPTAGEFDFMNSVPAQSDQELLIPTSQDGRYYLLLKMQRKFRGANCSTSCAATPTDFGLLAQVVPFGINIVSPSVVGNSEVTLLFNGTRWDQGTTFALRDVATKEIVEPIEATIESNTQARVRFDLARAKLGAYDVLVFSGNSETALPNGLRVEPAIAPIVQVDAANATPIRKGTTGSQRIVISNNGNVDIRFLDLSIGTWADDNLGLSIVGNPRSQTIQAGDLQQHRLLLERIPPKGQVAIQVLVSVGAAFGGSELPLFASATPFDHDGFRDGPWSNMVNNFALAAADLAGDDRQLADFYMDQFPSKAKELFDSYELDAPQVSRLFSASATARSSGASGGSSGFCDWGPEAVGGVCGLACVGVSGGIGIAGCAMACTGASAYVSECCQNPCDPFCPGAGDCRQPKPGKCEPYCKRVCTKEGWILTVDAKGNPKQVWACKQYDQKCSDPEPCTPTPASGDPNEKQGMSVNGHRLAYRILFENRPEATAPAAGVFISDRLDAGLNLGSCRLGGIHLGNTTINVPNNRVSYQTRVNALDARGVYVDIAAGVNAATREVFWQFRSSDPATGEAPTDGHVGFLPPEDGTGRGKGWVEFSVEANSNVPSGSVIHNTSTITFDNNEPILTNDVVTNLDMDAPNTRVESLPDVQSSTDVSLTWTGTDVGSGIAYLTLYGSLNGEPYEAVAAVPDPNQSIAVFAGARGGGRYRFYSIGTDRSGNDEAPPESPDAVTNIPVQVPQAPDLGIPTATSIALLDLGSINADAVEHAIQDSISGRWVGADGRLQDAPVWQGLEAWRGVSAIGGLTPVTTYAFQTLARSADGGIVGPGPSTRVTTLLAGLAVEKRWLGVSADGDQSGTVTEGDTLGYLIKARNIAAVAQTNVTPRDDLTGDSTVCGTLAAGADCALTVRYTVTADAAAAERIVNVASAVSDEAERARSEPVTVVPGCPIADVDCDHIPDAWEVEHFGLLSRDGAGDFDGDGILDREEYQSGSDPKVADRYLRIPLQAGTNLIAYPFPVAVEHATCAEWLGALGGPQMVESLSRLDPATQEVQTCNAQGGLDFAVHTGEAYAIKMRGARDLILLGEAACRDIQLQPGVNWVGHPRPPQDLTCTAWLETMAPGKLAAIQRLNAATARYETCGKNLANAGAATSPVGSDFPIEPGQGYIVHATAAGRFTPPGCAP